MRWGFSLHTAGLPSLLAAAFCPVSTVGARGSAASKDILASHTSDVPERRLYLLSCPNDLSNQGCLFVRDGSRRFQELHYLREAALYRQAHSCFAIE
jgi:hypothetical protein